MDDNLKCMTIIIDRYRKIRNENEDKKIKTTITISFVFIMLGKVVYILRIV